jgi:hypothetical protein
MLITRRRAALATPAFAGSPGGVTGDSPLVPRRRAAVAGEREATCA